MRAVAGVVGVGLGMGVRWRAVAGAGPSVGWIAGGAKRLDKGIFGWLGDGRGFYGIGRVVAR